MIIIRFLVHRVETGPYFVVGSLLLNLVFFYLMGCCGSRIQQPSVDPVDESTPLINHSDSTNDPYLRFQNTIQNTAELLIDISSARMLDRLQQGAIQERALEYSNLVKKLPPDFALPIFNRILSSDTVVLDDTALPLDDNTTSPPIIFVESLSP
ncbi:hypothetical protein BC833DRAFT_603186 [Globomyces pollinis-pini]|nr:hypothetical protein BC833DRAFT_603186 [Globomyces pollinis-pini]